MKKQIRVLVLCAAMVFSALQAQAATVPLMDSSQMNLNAINAVSGVSVVSVGTVIVWGASTNPYDEDKWLECDGRAFSAATYPDLASIYPSLRVPDYRNQFVRGGEVAQVGQVTADSTRSHGHQIDQHQHTVSGSSGVHTYRAPAAGGGGYFRLDGTSYHSYGWGIDVGGGILNAGGGGHGDGYSPDLMFVPLGGGGSTSASTSGGSISGFTNTAGATSTHQSGGAETAPQHIRVRYLIRALP